MVTRSKKRPAPAPVVVRRSPSAEPMPLIQVLDYVVQWFEAAAPEIPAALAPVLEDARWHLVQLEKSRAAKRAIDGNQLARLLGEAQRAACAEFGLRWALIHGAYVLATVPEDMRVVRLRDTTRKLLKDHHVPVARFWPGGVYPKGLHTQPPPEPAPAREPGPPPWAELSMSERLAFVEKAGLPSEQALVAEPPEVAGPPPPPPTAELSVAA